VATNFFWRGSITTIPIPRSDDERADHVPTDDPGAVIDLLARAGADLNARDQSGSSALHVAVAEQVVEALIRGGANVNIRDNSGRSPLMVAVSLRFKKLLLLQAGDQP
jgi:ankyrin repeat protein